MSKLYPWLEEDVETLRRMAHEGCSADVIMNALPSRDGLTPSRSAVIGKAYRLGVSLGFNRNLSAENAANARKARVRGQTLRVAGAASMERTPKWKKLALPKEPPPPLDMPKDAPCGSYAILGLIGRACNWPVGDPQDDAFRYCCAEAAPEHNYCAHHRTVSVSRNNDWKKRITPDRKTGNNTRVGRREKAFV